MPSIKEEVTFKDIYFKLKGWFAYLLTKWLWLIAAGFVCAVIGLIYAWTQKPKYTADLTFILANNSSNAGSLYGLASEFGIDLSSNSDVFSDNNIISLMTSQTMVQKALLQKLPNQN
ncbi:MAG TPA: Wzz/FepE/Etk N-terminal domain-containing protein, partial [Parafilimonas sp.]